MDPTKIQFGVTKPISTAGPADADTDTQRSLELEKLLVDARLYESEEEAIKREEVLGQIDQIVKVWVKTLTQQRGYTEQMVKDANAVIFTFGSCRLGVHGPGADIDTLCVGPSYVNREEDFIILHDILSQMEEVSELQPVPDAHVPVMKFKFNGIYIGLLYASISFLVVPEDLDISQGLVLCNVDEPTVRSLKRPRSSRNSNNADEECGNGSWKGLKRKDSLNANIDGHQKRGSVSPVREKPERENSYLHSPCNAEAIKVETSSDSANRMEVSQEEIDVECASNAENINQESNGECLIEEVVLESQHVLDSEPVLESGSFPIELEVAGDNREVGGEPKCSRVNHFLFIGFVLGVARIG